ncbi:MAG TPA: hypothetical protein PLF17_06115 [Chitinophagaceae bacterium]|nr:hypothetical protein [Chitinophagaceae bacterium]
MKLLKTISASIAFLLFSMSCNSFDVSPYAGVDGQINRMRFKDGYGRNLFPKHFPQVNLYVGLKHNDSAAIEAGYISEAVRNKTVTLVAGQSLRPSIPEILSPAIFKSYIKVRGFHLGFVNTFREPNWDSFRVLFGAGAGFLRAEASREGLAFGKPPIKGTTRRFKKEKVVLRLMIASEYKFKNKLGIRGSLFFLQTSKMVMVAEPTASPTTPVIRPMDSLVYSLGVFYEF